MKEQNNIEGNVDKTSLKCKGVWMLQIFFLWMFPLWHLSLQSTSFLPKFIFSHLHPLTLSSYWPHPPHIYCTLPASVPPSLPPLIHPSNKNTDNHAKEKKNHWFWRFLSFSPLSSNWGVWDQLFCTIMANNKTPAPHHPVHSTDKLQQELNRHRALKASQRWRFGIKEFNPPQ